MRRMNERLKFAQSLYFIPPWSIAFARGQWRYAIHVASTSSSLLWSSRVLKFNPMLVIDEHLQSLPYRSRGRPVQRWDDWIQKFCVDSLGMHPSLHWSDRLKMPNIATYEDEFVIFLSDAIVESID